MKIDAYRGRLKVRSSTRLSECQSSACLVQDARATEPMLLSVPVAPREEVSSGVLFLTSAASGSILVPPIFSSEPEAPVDILKLMIWLLYVNQDQVKRKKISSKEQSMP